MRPIREDWTATSAASATRSSSSSTWKWGAAHRSSSPSRPWWRTTVGSRRAVHITWWICLIWRWRSSTVVHILRRRAVILLVAIVISIVAVIVIVILVLLRGISISRWPTGCTRCWSRIGTLLLLISAVVCHLRIPTLAFEAMFSVSRAFKRCCRIGKMPLETIVGSRL